MAFVHRADTWEALCSLLKKCTPDACRTLDYISRKIEAGATCTVYQEAEFGLATDTIVIEFLIDSTGDAEVYKFHIGADALRHALLDARREVVDDILWGQEFKYGFSEELDSFLNTFDRKREGDTI